MAAAKRGIAPTQTLPTVFLRLRQSKPRPFGVVTVGWPLGSVEAEGRVRPHPTQLGGMDPVAPDMGRLFPLLREGSLGEGS